MGINTLGLKDALYEAIHKSANLLGISLRAKTYDQQFRELIEKASVKGKVVILIDEYDKMIIDYLDDPPKVDEHQKIMRSFYSILKGLDAYIRFLMLTGVSRFSKMSIFSDLNNLEELMLLVKYSF